MGLVCKLYPKASQGMDYFTTISNKDSLYSQDELIIQNDLN